MNTTQLMEITTSLGVLCTDDGRKGRRPPFRLGRTFPWYVELLLMIAAGPISFKIAVAVFTWLGI